MSEIKDNKTGYNSSADNFVYKEATDEMSVDELTVTITLNEYRKLVADQATMNVQIKKAEEDKWARDNENKKLKQENEQMKAEMFDLKKKLEEFEASTAACSGRYKPPTSTEEAEE